MPLVFKAITYWKFYSAGKILYETLNIGILQTVSLLTIYSIQLILFTYYLPMNNTHVNKALKFSIPSYEIFKEQMFFIKGANIGNHYTSTELYSALKWDEIK